MLNIYPFIKENEQFQKLSIDELLFVEFKCPVEEVKLGIWSDVNYFVFVTSGKKMWRSIHNEYILEKGDSLFVKRGANLAHQYFDEDYCALMVFIPDAFIKKFMNRFSDIIQMGKNAQKTDAVIRVALDDYLEGYVNSLASFFSAREFPNTNLLKLKFEELLLNIFTRPVHKELAQYFMTLNKSMNAHMEQVMNENFAYNLKLEDFAALCNLSLSSFKRTFKDLYHMSPGKWLTEKRLDFSAHLLRTSDKNINEVAFEVGFEESSSFIRAFKQKFDTTPLKYKAAAI
jgi:AraC-like DNA-binding protein